MSLTSAASTASPSTLRSVFLLLLMLINLCILSPAVDMLLSISTSPQSLLFATRRPLVLAWVPLDIELVQEVSLWTCCDPQPFDWCSTLRSKWFFLFSWNWLRLHKSAVALVTTLLHPLHLYWKLVCPLCLDHLISVWFLLRVLCYKLFLLLNSRILVVWLYEFYVIIPLYHHVLLDSGDYAEWEPCGGYECCLPPQLVLSGDRMYSNHTCFYVYSFVIIYFILFLHKVNILFCYILLYLIKILASGKHIYKLCT